MTAENSKKKLLVLHTSASLGRSQVHICERALTLLHAKKIPFESLDGADLANKERYVGRFVGSRSSCAMHQSHTGVYRHSRSARRNELFAISGIRGNYPQFFLVDEHDNVEFLGNWDKIEAVNDASSLPDEILEANPSIITWDKVLGQPISPHS